MKNEARSASHACKSSSESAGSQFDSSSALNYRLSANPGLIAAVFVQVEFNKRNTKGHSAVNKLQGDGARSQLSP